MQSYKTRVASFWNWFEQNESQLEKYITNMVEYDHQEVVSFLSSGLNLAIDGCMFETGGSLEVSLAAEGSLPVMFLSSHLINNMPEKFRGKWIFTPWKPSMPGGRMRINETEMGPEDIWVVPVLEDDGSFALTFYNRELAALEEEQAYHIFYLILEMTLGENICMSYISAVDFGGELPEGAGNDAVALSGLMEHMRGVLKENERELDENVNPCMSYSGYGLEGEENAPPRYDIIAGFTRLTSLLNDYYNEETNAAGVFETNGAKAMFIAYGRTDQEDHNVDLAMRNQIADRLEEEVLGPEDSGQEIGVILGQAIGIERCYIDLLLYDEEAFWENAPKVLDDYNLDFSFYSFGPDEESPDQ